MLISGALNPTQSPDNPPSPPIGVPMWREYPGGLDGLGIGIDILELKRLEAKGIPTNLALEVMAIVPKVINGTATPEEIVRGLMILTPSLRKQLE